MTNKNITVIGLGAGNLEQMSLGVYNQLTQEKGKIFVRTLDHPVMPSLIERGVTFFSFDSVYENHDDFEAVYEEIVDALLVEATNKDIVYAVPGHPMLAERTVKLLLEKEKEDANLHITLKGGQSYLDSMFSALKIDPIEGFQFIDATSFDRFHLQYGNHLIFSQVYDQMIASEVKLALLEDLPHDFLVYIVNAAGTEEEWVKEVPLFELDRTISISNLMSIYVPPVDKKYRTHQFTSLREVIAELRGPNGCPWDQKQTHDSLRPYLIEEAYEVIEAINEKDDTQLADELGDVLLQIMLHSQIGEEAGYFTVDDVIRNITEKMIRRHPHVFQKTSVTGEEDVLTNWEEIKKKEKGNKGNKQSLLEGIEKSLPALLYAKELQAKAAKVGFDWNNPEPMWEKVTEEIKEFKEVIENSNLQAQEEEFGDILFSLINIARFYRIDPELALFRTNKKFQSRFQYMEHKIKANGNELLNMTLKEMDHYWELAKKAEKEREQ
ncbi:tetrapyrrole methylase family protein/MazG family protein [Salirhabdus euzebyi]|uniref:Tetrapyrrole methylase family protein/MazG family protein n=1 Tax=Salirhabdus euzebyi TaxID=394506 RepID=A0A841Q9R9_9BACI|nr:nucleoside triphosphate pyrophosphohydrolase [Salirhabdus euzebyi]MBB6455251.1 tetrapyrrole methylase family protein/MazG family protein [Salirhabdus euzebyi]